MKSLIKNIAIIAGLIIAVSASSCSKEDLPEPQVELEAVEGTADVNGEYYLNGTIRSQANLDKVIIYKVGVSTPVYIDDSTAKNKNEYVFSYLITGVFADTFYQIDIYDINKTKISFKYLIKAYPR